LIPINLRERPRDSLKGRAGFHRATIVDKQGNAILLCRLLELTGSQTRAARPALDRCYQDGFELARAGAHWLRRGGRRVWQGETRIHVAVREVPPKESVRLARRLQASLESVEGVRWARFHAPLGHAVIELDASHGGVSERDRLTDVLVAQVAAAEVVLGLSHRPFLARAHPEHHPGDPVPILLAVLEGSVDLASSVASFGMRRLRLPARPLNLELMAVIDSVADIPGLRKGVERQLSILVTDVWLEVAAAALRPLVRGDLSGAAGSLHRYLRVRELLARRATWSRWEPRLFGTPEAVADARPVPAGARPVPLPDGPLERGAARLALGAFSAFGGVWFTSGRLEPATAAIFAGLPRPAHLGRDAFASRLGYRLARADVLVLDPQVLRRLDRLDCVAVDAVLCESATLDCGRLAATIDHAGLQLVWVGPGRLPAAARRHNRRLVAGPGRAVRRLQEEGRGVVYLGSVAAGLAAADCGLCLVPSGQTPASTAHILAPGGIEQAMTLVDAVAAAHRASRESVQLSSVKIALAVALASTGLSPATTQRILSVAGLASMLAMVNGIRVANGVTVTDPAALAPPEHAWHRMRTGEVLTALGSGVDGISEADARRRSAPPPRERSAAGEFARLVGEELDSPLTPVLGAGAALSFLTGARTDAAMITSVILFNALYGGAQRFRTEALIRQLSRRERQRVLVRRDGGRITVVETALVPGDVIELAAGEAVPGHCRILDATALAVDEASLTGESMPVAKTAAPCDAAEIAGRRSMLYAGTHVVSGDVTAVVTAVGASTESGRAARLAAGAGISTGVEERLRSLTAYAAPVAATAGVPGGPGRAFAGATRARDSGNRCQSVRGRRARRAAHPGRAGPVIRGRTTFRARHPGA